MSGMDQFLAQYYGTAGATQSTENLDKEAEASMEMFAKVAAAEGIDLASMSDADVMALYERTMKTAEEEEGGKAPPFAKKEEGKDEEKEKKEKEAAAQAELAAKTASSQVTAEQAKEASAKIAEADYLGRVMAHAYVNEMKKIAEAQPATEGVSEEKVANMKAKFLENLNKGKAMAGAAAGKAKEHGGAMASKLKEHGAKGLEAAKKHPGKTHGAAAAAGAGAGFAAGKKKESSALDELAAERAMAKAAEAGLNIDEAAEKLAKVVEEGFNEENTKIAAAQGNLEAALEIRSLELLESAGYPVTWQ